MHSIRVTNPDLPLLDPLGLPTREDTPLVVAVSGGVDSSVLLHLLRSAIANPLVAAHLDHGLRPVDELDADLAALRTLCTRLSVPLVTRSVNIRRSAFEHSESLESAGRRERLQFLAETALECGSSLVALAHHADDQAETVLFRLLRGAGARGLAAMRPVSHLRVNGSPIQILRPLLPFRKSDLLQIAKKSEIPFHEDSSNATNAFARNRIRNILLPALHAVLDRDPVPALARSASLLAEDEDFLQSLAAHLDPESATLSVRALVDLAAPVLSRVLVQWLEANGVKDLSHLHLQNVQRLLSKRSPAKVNLPGNRVARRKEGILFLETLHPSR